MRTFLRAVSALLLLALWAAGCTVKKTEPPVPTGPSELATAITLTATPDTLAQDGASQSQIAMTVRDAGGQPLRGLELRLEIALNGVVQDFGRLSAKRITTGSDGRATVVYTAPDAIAGFTGQTLVSILATPVGTNASTQLPRAVEIRLVPPGVITPPGPRVPDFRITPDKPNVLQQVQFDATDDKLDPLITSYQWTFGDGGTGHGRIATHQYRSPGDFVVTLTVTDVSGSRSSRPKTVAVGEGERPKADFTFSPTSPQPEQDVFFNASSSTAGPARHLTRYDWNFGDGRSGSGATTSLRYEAQGTYTVTLTVTDNVGLTSTASKTVGVGHSAERPKADFTFSPTEPRPADAVFFNAAASSAPAGRQIVSYVWDFGNGQTGSGPSPVVQYLGAATYTVTLTITDSAGFTGTSSKPVKVTAPTQ
jgi:PKD repeat protein